MRNLRQIERFDVASTVFLTFSSLLTFIPFARLDFDIYHDGYMGAVAVALEQGKIPHRDVLMQYGPLLSIFQALSLKLNFPIILTLRVFNVFLIVAAIGLLSDLSRRLPSYLNFSPVSTKISAFVVLLTADFFYGVPMLPWSSTLVFFLITSHVYFLVANLHLIERERIRSANLHLIFAGISLGLIFFTRIQFFIIFFPFMTLSVWFERQTPKRHLRTYLFLSTVALTTILFGLLFLGFFGSLSSWWQQTIVWPRRLAQGFVKSWIIVAYTQLRSLAIPAGFLLSCCIAISRHSHSSKKESPYQTKYLRTLLCILASVSFVWLNFAAYFRPYEFWVAGNFKHLPIFGTIVMVFWLLVTITVLALFQVSKKLIKLNLFSSQNLVLFWGLGLSVTSLSQAFPVPDSRHYWWAVASSIFILPFSSLTINKSVKKFLFGSILTMTALSSIFSINGSLTYLSYLRVPGDKGAVNEQMLSRPNEEGFLLNFNDSFRFLKNSLPNDERLIFLLKDGAYAVFDGQFNSSDPWFVSWGPVPPLEMRLGQVRFVVSDISLSDQDLKTLISNGFVKTRSSLHLTLFERNYAKERE